MAIYGSRVDNDFDSRLAREYLSLCFRIASTMRLLSIILYDISTDENPARQDMNQAPHEAMGAMVMPVVLC
eukprot:2110489-Amphidinium_carterae.1